MRHCLEKNPEERFYPARDLAFDLEALSGTLGPDGRHAAAPAGPETAGWLAAARVAAAVALVAGRFAASAPREAGSTPAAVLPQLTFRRGADLSARFAPDGQTVVYSSAWDGKPDGGLRRPAR